MTPAFSNSNPSRVGTRPAASNRRSASRVSPSLVFKITRPSLDSIWLIERLLYTSIPSFLKVSSRVSPANLSANGNKWASIWTMVVLQPNREKACAISDPIAPPPIINILSGIASRLNRFSLVKILSTVSNPGIGGIDGLVPVQIKILLAVILRSPTATVWESTKLAAP